uniref:Uncharacterized protein n=1 Tax=Oryzias sinensis TaxID=183150 RepID=A0A8C7WZD7_9TELE
KLRCETAVSVAADAENIDIFEVPFSPELHKYKKFEVLAELKCLIYLGSTFNLRVQVNDLLCQRHLSKAVVEVFINYTRNSTPTLPSKGKKTNIKKESQSEILFLTLYLYPLYFTPEVFSSVTVSLLELNQGNMWLFEDYVVITGKAAGTVKSRYTSFCVTFPRLQDTYMTIPQLKPEVEQLQLSLPFVTQTD